MNRVAENASLPDRIAAGDTRAVARAISRVEDGTRGASNLMKEIFPHTGRGLVIGITGAPGAGKSSLVAWMSRHGARFLCDDILPLRQQGRAVWGYSGLAQLRLEPLGARKLGWREAHGMKREPREKSKFAVVAARGPRRVARIYLLERGKGKARGEVHIRRLEPRAAFRALLRSTRNDSLDTPERLRRQMRLFAHLARTVPVCYLRYPNNFAALLAVLARIRQDLCSAAL